MRVLLAPLFTIILVANANPSVSDPSNSAQIQPDAMNIWGGDPRVSERIGIYPIPDETPTMPSCGDNLTKAQASTKSDPLELQREPASPDQPHAIYAVDRREGGCALMVMMGDRDDVRRLPAPMEGPLQITPARTDQ